MPDAVTRLKTIGDVKMYGSSSTKYVFLDASADTFTFTNVTCGFDGVSYSFGDDDFCKFGDSDDVTVEWDTALTPDQLIIRCAADDTIMTIGVSAATQLSFDVQWFANESTGASYLYADASANLLYTVGVDLQFKDDDFLVFGTGGGASGDVSIEWDTAANPDQLQVAVAADDTLISIGISAATQLSADVKWFANESSGASFLYCDASANLVYTTGVDLQFLDDDFLVFGTGAGASGDVNIEWDTSATPDQLIVAAAADDTVITIGNGTNSFDVDLYGNIATAKLGWDASANTLTAAGPVRMNTAVLGSRYQLEWVAGSRGKPGINADIQNSSEAVRMIADPDFEVQGTNGVTASTAYNVEGGITITTAGAADDQVIIAPHADTSQSAWGLVTWGTDRETHWEADISTGSNITNVIIWAGLKLTSSQAVTTDNDQVFFRFEDDVNSGEWQVVSSIANVDTETDTNVLVATSTRYHLKITIDSSRVARAYLNGVLMVTTAALTAADLIPFIGIENDGGAGGAKSMVIHGQTISRLIGA